MSQLVLDTLTGLPVPKQTREIVREERKREELATSIYILCGILAAIQILDGILTAMGIARFGVSIEGNPLVKGFMLQLGYIPALILTKSIALLIIAGIARFGLEYAWVTKALGALIAVYMMAAIVPWITILLS